MIYKVYKVLVIEDNPSDAGLIAAYLANSFSTSGFDLVNAVTLGDGFKILDTRTDIDVLLLDLNLPDSCGIETFYKAHGRYPDLPIIILSSNSNEEIYINAIDQGAQDYVSKDSLKHSSLTKTICNAHRRMQIRSQLQQANKMKTEFLSHMSHEIRTPLNGVIGVTDLLLATNLDSKQRELATLARESGELLLAIVNDILDISKIESGKIELEVSNFDFVKLVKSCASMFESSFEAKNIGFSMVLPVDPPRMLTGDSTKIRQILINLLNNAAKYTMNGSVILKVEIIEQEQTGIATLKFFIEDTGIGISVEKQNELFRPFAQGDRSPSRRFGGAGLGLAISQAFVNLMGGTLTVESCVGRGSLFSFCINLHRPETPTLQSFKGNFQVIDQKGGVSGQQEILAHSENQSEAISPKNSALIGSGRKALIVEDNFVNQLVIDAMMKSLGFEVALAKSGSEALTLTSGSTFDVILMDCQMPEMDGFEATKKIREQEHQGGHWTPIVAITAGVTSDERDRCYLAGMDAFLSKPIKIASLETAIHKIFKSTDHFKINNEMIESQVIRDLWSLGNRVGRDVLGEVFQIFQTRTIPMVDNIQQSLKEDDRSELGKSVHALKGSAMHLGALEMVSICEEFEGWARSDKIIPKDFLMAKLQRSITATTSAIRDEIAKMNR